MAIWEVEDGYAGKTRNQETYIPDEKLKGLTEEERQELIEEYVRADFAAMGFWIKRVKEE